MDKDRKKIFIGIVIVQMLVMLYLFIHKDVFSWHIIVAGFMMIAISFILILKFLNNTYSLINPGREIKNSASNNSHYYKSWNKIKQLYASGEMNAVINYINSSFDEYDIDYKTVSDLEILNVIIQKYNYVCKTNKIDLAYTIDGNLKNMIKKMNLSAEELCTLLGNLLDNSVDVLKAKGHDKKLFFSILNTDNALSLIVINNGEKISEKNQKKIFNYGYSTKIGASGAGLFIVYKLAKKVGATIKLESNSKETRFEILFNTKH